ncbi:MULTISPECIES: M15 family metallopeptidase [Clostridium]|uniref:M15 family metallopeptidase n=1 Tax=Clostridium TaxID=1485 RepID=UPI0011C7BD4A|nr:MULTISPECIES: M15 family metallopeptidase [Clostridium]MDB2124013.1 M15 family metallopeptidase [Clostridium paraputrificum]MDU1824745.1 M15 family metallopeptidase [Clostridium sp.]MDU1842736.1 M15 family metallopeptidase [Clostridium sp.]MDU2691780.1 M15 family metallopeptidase [Clostridium sp.]MDU2957630.1 M15 family metallopeptidase [Clostridium sp.]
MKKILVGILSFLLIFSNIYIIPKANETNNYERTMKQDILTLMIAYPESVQGVVKENDKVYCVMTSGKKILYDDKKEKTHDEKLANADLQDTLEQIYPLNIIENIMEKNFEPGRIRNYELLNEVYGSSKIAIEKNLKPLKYGYTNYQFNSKNNANISLEKALKEVIPLAQSRNDIGAILYPASGTYNYRIISGTGRLSAHSYGIAIDLKSDLRDYWKWASPEKGRSRLLEYPRELIEAFENNNFVWGGKWGHFDILHFEYRPEIIIKAKYFSNSDLDKPWFHGVPSNDEHIKKCIELIDNTLKEGEYS